LRHCACARHEVSEIDQTRYSARDSWPGKVTTHAIHRTASAPTEKSIVLGVCAYITVEKHRTPLGKQKRGMANNRTSIPTDLVFRYSLVHTTPGIPSSIAAEPLTSYLHGSSSIKPHVATTFYWVNLYAISR
jgi:hypothetical protein